MVIINPNSNVLNLMENNILPKEMITKSRILCLSVLNLYFKLNYGSEL